MGLSAQARTLVAIAMVGQLVAFLLTVLLARLLTLEEFEAYVVASAAFVLLATFSPRGLEKYALLRLPALLRASEWARARGLIEFGIRRTLATALLAGSLVAAWSWWTRPAGDGTRLALIVTCLSLPAGALVHLGVELLTAAGRPLPALAIFRIGVPVLALIFILVLHVVAPQLTGAMAVGGWGLAWVVAVALLVLAFRDTDWRAFWHARSEMDARTWRAEARPFLAYRLSLALLGQAGIVSLDLLQTSSSEVGAFAAALSTVGIAAMFATATNRIYGRELSLRLERREFDALLHLRRERLRWVGPSMLVFLVATIGFPHEILGLFRSEFAAEGANALRLLALSTAFTVIFSLAPTYLKFRGRNGAIYGIVAAAAAAQLALLALLIPAYGVTGAAAAHGLAMTGLYAAFAVIGHREIRSLRGRRDFPASR